MYVPDSNSIHAGRYSAIIIQTPYKNAYSRKRCTGATCFTGG